MSDILVIETPNLILKPKQMKDLQESVTKQRETGVVVLPWYCKATVIPDDCEIVYEEERNE